MDFPTRAVPIEDTYPTERGGGAPMPAVITPQVKVAQAAVGKKMDMQKMLIPAIAIGGLAFFMMQKKKK